jgi:GNAT superfamily N-acetyltransferase
MDDSALRALVRGSLAHEQQLVGTHVPGAHAISLVGVVAAVVPSVPESSIANAAVVVDPDSLTPAVIADLDAAYGTAGVPKWGVWFDPQHRDVQGVVSAAGLVFDSHPKQMGGVLAEMPLGEAPPARALSSKEAGRVNDLAYGHPDDRLERMLGSIPDDVGRTYAAFDDDGDPTSVVTVSDHDGDAAVWFVATVPWARGQGHATRLMRRALLDARERGCVTTTLIASQLGAPVYAKLGYRALGELHLWERRP